MEKNRLTKEELENVGGGVSQRKVCKYCSALLVSESGRQLNSYKEKDGNFYCEECYEKLFGGGNGKKGVIIITQT